MRRRHYNLGETPDVTGAAIVLVGGVVLLGLIVGVLIVYQIGFDMID